MCVPKPRALAFLPYVPMCLIFFWLVAEHQPKGELSAKIINSHTMNHRFIPMCFPKHRALAFLPYVSMCLIFCWLVAEHQPKEKNDVRSIIGYCDSPS